MGTLETLTAKNLTVVCGNYTATGTFTLDLSTAGKKRLTSCSSGLLMWAVEAQANEKVKPEMTAEKDA